MAPPKNKTTTKPAASKPTTTAKQTNAPPTKTASQTEQPAAIQKVATAPSSLAPTAAPAWLQKKMETNGGPRGLDKMDNADMILPRLVLAQSMTPEVQNAADNGLGIMVGDIFDNLTKTILAKGSRKENGQDIPAEELVIIPIVLGKARFHLQPFSDGGGILCRSDDALTARPGGDGVDEGGQPTRGCGNCIRKEWDEETGKPECSLFYNIVVLLPQFNYAAYVFSGKHTNVKVFKRLLSSMKQVNADIFALKYAIRSVTEKSTQFTYKNFDFRPLGYVEEQEYMRAEAFYKSLEGKSWTPDTSDIEQDVAAQEASQTDDEDPTPEVPASEAVVDAETEAGADEDGDEIPF